MIENTFYLLSQNFKITKKLKILGKFLIFFFLYKRVLIICTRLFIFKIKIENVQKEFASKIYYFLKIIENVFSKIF